VTHLTAAVPRQIRGGRRPFSPTVSDTCQGGDASSCPAITRPAGIVQRVMAFPNI
jgi:hypothetical protein